MSSRPEMMHLDLDAFFASVEQKLHSELRGKPVIVCNVDPQGRNCYGSIVSTASYEARIFGVKSGMPTFQAKKLCPQGLFVKGSFGEYEKHSQAVFSILKRFVPFIEPISLDEAFLDFSHTSLIYPDLIKVAQKIKDLIKKEVGLTASVGLASTKIVAKVASDFNKPDGLTVVNVGEEKTFLSPLPLRALPGIGVQTEKIFKKWQLETIHDLASLPEKMVSDILGKAGLNLWRGANGFDSVWFSHQEVQKSLSRSMTFPKSKDKDYLLKKLLFLTEKVCSDLREKKFKASLVEVHLRFADFTTKRKQIAISLSLDNSMEIYKVAENLFFQFWGGSVIRLIGIGVSHLTSQENSSQLNLFADKLIKLDQSVDKIRDKYGFSSVTRAALLPTKPT